MYPLVETIKILDGTPMHLEWHQRRMDYAFHVLFGSNNPMQLKECLLVEEVFTSGVVKCRFLYNDKTYKTEFSNYVCREITSLQLVEGNAIDYSHKYTNRKMLTDLLDRRGVADDILIVRDGLITDTSFTNIVFFNGNFWVTPSDPLLEGTCRNRLLAEGVIVQDNIRPDDLSLYTSYRLINAMMDFEGQTDIDIDGNIFTNNTI